MGGATRVRFAPSPLAELALSTMIVRYPDRHPFHSKWHADTARARARVGEERILALINEKKWVIDTILRHPVRRGATFAAEMTALADVPSAVFRRDAERVWGDPPSIMGRTDDALKNFVLQTVSDYWDTCFAAYWPAFRAVLDADVIHRGSLLAAQGAHATITGAIHHFAFDRSDLVLQVRDGMGFRRDVASDGVTFLPTLVKWNTNVPNHGDADMLFSYRARGRGRLSEVTPDDKQALIGVIGRTRTELLLSLEEPASSTAVGLFMGTTTTAANQHLRALAGAGLLQASRFGKYVLYERTTLAEDLIAAS